MIRLPRRRIDAPTTARVVGLPPHGALTLFFRWRKKSVQKKASGTATPEAAHVAMHCGQALRCAWAWLRASWLSAISGVSRPSASLGRGLRSAGRTVGRPKSRNSLTTFRGQTALRGCPRARGVRCRIAPYRSLCSPPTLPAGRFGLRPRPHWGHASLRDSSLRSPAGKKPFNAHF